jgi:hypothetical protein
MSMTHLSAATKRFGLALVVVLAGCGTKNAATSNARAIAVVQGTVTAGPTCPVERVGYPCPPRPVLATIRASVGSRVVASTRSAPDGSYRLELPMGTSTITAAPGSAFPRCNPRQVNVVSGDAIEVDISCDTGIRATGRPDRAARHSNAVPERAMRP